MSISEVVLIRSLCGSFVLGRLEYLQQRPYELRRLKYLLPGPLQKKLTDPRLDSKLHVDGHWLINALALSPMPGSIQ